MSEIKSSKYVKWKDMTWPKHIEHDDDCVEWRLRYGQVSREDLLFAASVMSAYRCLVLCTDKKRKEVVNKLRKMCECPKNN